MYHHTLSTFYLGTYTINTKSNKKFIMKAPLLALIPYYALAAALDRKKAELSSLRSQIDSQLNHFTNVIDSLSQRNAATELADAPAVEHIYNDIDTTTLKLTSLMSRTEKLMQRVGDYNKQSLQKVGLKERLDAVLSDEMTRRGRFLESDLTLEGDGSNNSTDEQSFISLNELDALFDHDKIIAPTENQLVHSFFEYTTRTLKETVQRESEAANEALDEAEKKYAAQLQSILSDAQKEISQGSCVTIPKSVELVQKDLHNHYLGVNMIDYASYENGGSIVYALTSAAYRPESRNHVQSNREDKTVEKMWFEQQTILLESERTSTKKEVKQWIEKSDILQWYTYNKLGWLRPYLPQDWERTLDWVFNRFSSGSWDEYTPRGVIDALIPDYVYQSLGFSEFGRTAGPDVAISSGESKMGATAVLSKQIGHCYPLSMHPDDDPSLSYLNRLEDFNIDTSSDSLLSGPKFTVRLSQPIHIDAVTLEHRSFPISKVSLGLGLKGGESAPRHVRIVGFPSCSDNEVENCKSRGFDITRPIALGSLEYQRVTVTGREDDYGGYEDEEESSRKRRQRSVQTFGVKGGKWKPQSSLDNPVLGPASPTEPEESQCTFDDLECTVEQQGQEKSADSEIDPIAQALVSQGGGGECKPNYDDMEAIPSCDDDSAQDSSSSERHVVAAVSFIFEENWGSPHYTCLYRVQVHGEVV